MREIRFRGRRIDGGAWIYGSLIKVDNPHVAGGVQAWIVPVEAKPENIIWTSLHRINIPAFAVDPETVGQFTGFHDKNRQEAYRDDIIETPYYIMGRESGSMRRGVIEFKDGCFGVQDGHEFVPLCNLRVPTKTEYIPNYGEKAVEFEIPWVIIGNIYENPDLLEVPHK